MEIDAGSLVPGPIKVDLNKFGQIGPRDGRASILHYNNLGTVQFIVCGAVMLWKNP
jgi:hypothetical protein